MEEIRTAKNVSGRSKAVMIDPAAIEDIGAKYPRGDATRAARQLMEIDETVIHTIARTMPSP